MVRYIAGVAAGIAAAVATILAVEMLGHLIAPVPPESDLRTLPVRAQLFVLAGWFLGALAGGTLAALIARRASPAWLVAALVAIGGVVMIFWLPHPELLQLASVVAPAAGGLIAGHFARQRFASSPGAAA